MVKILGLEPKCGLFTPFVCVEGSSLRVISPIKLSSLKKYKFKALCQILPFEIVHFMTFEATQFWVS